jgi:hypothetical protein
MFAVTRTPIADAGRAQAPGGFTWGKSAPDPAGEQKAEPQPGR